MILSLTGLISTGKDTVADYLVEYHGFARYSFASSVKDTLSVIFNWDRESLEGRTAESREWRNQVDPWWAERLGISDFSPRIAMQCIGTDVLRNHFNDDIWIASLEHKLLTVSGNVVITDARYPNELKMVKQLDGKLWRIERGAPPPWYDYAKRYNAASEETKATLRLQATSEDDAANIFNCRIHSSEWAWIGSEFDLTLSNNGNIASLQNTIEESLSYLGSDPMPSTPIHCV